MSAFEALYTPYIDPAVAAAEGQAVRDNIAVSSNPATNAFQELLIDPSRLARRRVVDLGSGTSDLVRTLCEHDADAIGIDIQYDNPDSLDEQSKQFIELMGWLDEVHPYKADRPFQKPEKRAEAQQASRLRFLEDFAAHPERYIAAPSTAIPRPNRSADFVVCYNFLSNSETLLPAFVTATTLEIVRILDRTGTSKIGPFKETKESGALMEYHDTDKIDTISDSLRLLEGVAKVKMARRKINAETTVVELVRQK